MINTDSAISVITTSPIVTDGHESARSLLAEFQALRTHVAGPRHTDATLEARRNAWRELRDRRAPMEERSAYFISMYLARPQWVSGDWIASAKNRCDEIVQFAAKLRPELRALFEAFDADLWSARDYEARLRAMNAKDDVSELIRLTWWNADKISRAHIDDLRRSTVDLNAALDAGLWSESWNALLSRILCDWIPDDRSEWLVFPYFRPSQEHPAGYGAKRVKSTRGRSGYRQSTGIPSGIYFPPNTRRSDGLRNVARALIWTEGEKKALCLDRIGYAVVGLPGVWNGRDTRLPKTNLQLHPWIREDVVVAGRTHVICFDRDLLTNENTRRAAKRLARMLRAAGATEVFLVNWPEERFGPKGVDDLADARGDAAVRDLIAGASPLVEDELWLPVSVVAGNNLTSAKKIALAALYSRSDKHGIVNRTSIARLAKSASRSRPATGELINGLVAQGLIGRRRGRSQKIDGRWNRKPSRYEIVGFDGLSREPRLRIHCSDIAAGDGVALALAVLRRNDDMRVGQLAEALGVARRTLTDILVAAGDRVQRRHGRVRLTPHEPWLESAESRPSLGEVRKVPTLSLVRTSALPVQFP